GTVGIHRYIANEAYIRKFLLYFPGGMKVEVIRIIAITGRCVFQRLRYGGKQHERLNPYLSRFVDFSQNPFLRMTVDSWHRPDGFFVFISGFDKQRIDQIRGAHLGFPDHIPDRWTIPVSSWSYYHREIFVYCVFLKGNGS